MDDRITAWLDGELPFDALDLLPRVEARALESTLSAAAARLSAVPRPDLTARVMTQLPPPVATHSPSRSASPRSAGAGLRAWLGHGGAAALRPAAALAAITLVIGFALGTLVATRGPAATDAAAPQLFVRFQVEAAGASDVRLAGSFTGWEPRFELTPLDDGQWTVTVPLEPGVHDYVFVLDGERYMIDPHAARVSDGFGGYSSRLALLAPGP
jgi:hypothetical protein